MELKHVLPRSSEEFIGNIIFATASLSMVGLFGLAVVGTYRDAVYLGSLTFDQKVDLLENGTAHLRCPDKSSYETEHLLFPLRPEDRPAYVARYRGGECKFVLGKRPKQYHFLRPSRN